MNQDIIISNVIQFIKELFNNDHSGHDYFHSLRVYQNAIAIAKHEECDEFLVSMAALLHDADDKKLFHSENYENARSILLKNQVDEKRIAKICDIIDSVSFKASDTIVPNSTEGRIVQDADRLDAIGAIGIARAFAYGGNREREIYNPDIEPMISMNAEEYKKHSGTTLNHFYEKLFLLKDMMNTNAAKQIAKKRHIFMQNYIEEFYSEWNGES